MSEELFKFGIDNPSKITKYTKRFVDLEGFLDENYEGEHHNVWDNKDECWLHLDDALCLMEKEYCTIKSENKQLRKEKIEANAFIVENGLAEEFVKWTTCIVGENDE